MEKNRLKSNIIAPLLNKLFGLVYSFVIPRLLISTYSSDVNGLVSSIGNFLSILALLDMGIGAVVQASMYKPLLEKNYNELSKVVKSSKKFFNNISFVFVTYVLVISFIYPSFIRKDFSFVFECVLVFIIALDSYSKTYMGYTNNLLITADQKIYLLSAFQIICTCFSFVITYVLIKMNVTIHFVLLASALIYSIKPLLIRIYVRNNYSINKSVTYDNEPINQKWNGIAQNLAYYVTTNTDVFVLTVFSTLSNVSIYSVYNMIVSGISNVIITAQAGVSPMLGQAIASNDKDKIKQIFEIYELISHIITTILFSCTLTLIIPFVRIYTKNIIDANYIQPKFAVLLTLALYINTLKQPYHSITLTAGHFKQTQTSSIIEMILNVVITCACVFKYGLPGVAIGTLVSIVYRTIYLVIYLPKISSELSSVNSIKLFAEDSIIVLLSYLICSTFELSTITYSNWIILAVKVSLITLAITLLIIVLTNFSRIKSYYFILKEKRYK